MKQQTEKTTTETAITAEFLARQKATIEGLIKRFELDLEVLIENITNTETPLERRMECQQEKPKKITKIELLKKALVRIEYNNYGKCRGCGEKISTDRLGAIPIAEYCTECAIKPK